MAELASFPEVLATVIFVIAVFHTFLVGKFSELSNKFSKDSFTRKFFHLLSEVELVFGFAAVVFLLGLLVHSGVSETFSSIQKLSFAEPVFVFAIMAIASTRPVLTLARRGIDLCAKILPLSPNFAVFFSILILGSLVGSVITEPAAMTVSALLLQERFFGSGMSTRFKYATLGLLFVNVSIGGTLTHFAAPPVLMIAGKWGWDSIHMFISFGWKAVLSILISTSLTMFVFRSELRNLRAGPTQEDVKVSIWLSLVTLVLMGVTVLTAHFPLVCLAVLGVLFGFSKFTREALKFKAPFMIAVFLSGLVVLGSYQSWWLKPLLSRLNEIQIYVGSTLLTAVVDNAALTFLGAQVEGLSDPMKYFLVAGAVVGGGLTVIANAPNPVGYSILKSSFGADGIKPLYLLLGALGPTLVAFVLFWTL